VTNEVEVLKPALEKAFQQWEKSTAAFALMDIWLIALVITGRQFWPKTGS
jgi:hypothetical protein